MKKENHNYHVFSNTGYMIATAWHSYKSVLVYCIALAVCNVAVAVLELFVTPILLQQVSTHARIWQIAVTIVLFAAGIAILRGMTGWLDENALYGRVAVRMKLIQQLGRKFQTTSYPHIDDPDYLKKLSLAKDACSDNYRPTEMIWTTLTSLLQNTVGFVLYLILLQKLPLGISLIILVITVIDFFFTSRLNNWGFRHREEKGELEKQLYYYSARETLVPLAKDIRLFGMKPWLDDIMARVMRMYRNFIAKQEHMSLGADAVDALLALLRNGIAYGYLLYMTLEKGWTVSEFLLLFSAISGFTMWVTGIMNNCTTLLHDSQVLTTVREFLDIGEIFRFEDGQPIEPNEHLSYEITLEHVSYRYPGAKTDTLHDINLTIHPGEKLAVVGLNGAGKTTLIKLIAGLYDPSEGRVLLNGRDIRQYNRRDYYRHFAAVFQTYSVYPLSVAVNVAQSLEPDEEKVNKCIAMAGMTNKINQLPDGIHTHLEREIYTDGVSLSGGELQRLMLARALYKDAPIILLDEPTAALDPIAEDEIYHRYQELTDQKLSVFVSHRLASTRFCDRILLIADGKIAEEGTHESLLAKGGIYAQLFEVQAQYYAKGGADYEENV